MSSPSVPPARPSSPSSPPHAPIVLVAEDEPEAADLIADILTREGFEVLLASDGAQALEIARELPRPDLILLDLELPVMDGRAFLNAMHSDPSLSGIPVVVVSGADDAATVRATDNVRKARLLEGLGRVIQRFRGPQEAKPDGERSETKSAPADPTRDVKDAKVESEPVAAV